MAGTCSLDAACRKCAFPDSRPKSPISHAYVIRGTASRPARDCNSPDKKLLGSLCAQGAIMSTLTFDKKADLAGPGIGDYTELEKILPSDYHSLLTQKRRSTPSSM